MKKPSIFLENMDKQLELIALIEFKKFVGGRTGKEWPAGEKFILSDKLCKNLPVKFSKEEVYVTAARLLQTKKSRLSFLLYYWLSNPLVAMGADLGMLYCKEEEAEITSFLSLYCRQNFISKLFKGLRLALTYVGYVNGNLLY